MTTTPDSDQAARWARREPLLVLISRMQRGVLLAQERDLLRAAVETELADGDQAREQLAAAHARPARKALTASDVLVQHDVTRKAMCDALDVGYHLNWQQIIDTAQRHHDANAEWQRDVAAARRGEAEAVHARAAAEAIADAAWREAGEARIRSGRHVAEARRNRDAWRNARRRARELATLYDVRQQETNGWHARAEKAERAANLLAGSHQRAERADAVLTRMRAELDRIAALPTTNRDDDHADSFGTGARWTLRMIRAALEGSEPAAPADLDALTVPTGPREPRPTSPDHPVHDLWEALVRPTPYGPEEATGLIRAYYTAITSGPPADPCAHGCRQAADDLTQLGQELDTDAEPEPKPREVCCVCGSPKVAYHNYREQPFCWPCANGTAQPAQDAGQAARGEREQPAEPLLRGAAPIVVSIDLGDADLAAVIRRMVQRPPGGRL
jgi:hypothetical protein